MKNRAKLIISFFNIYTNNLIGVKSIFLLLGLLSVFCLTSCKKSKLSQEEVQEIREAIRSANIQRLKRAIEENNINIAKVETLPYKGINVYGQVIDWTRSPLMLSIDMLRPSSESFLRKEQLEIVAYLLSQGCDVKEKSKENHTTPFIEFCSNISRTDRSNSMALTVRELDKEQRELAIRILTLFIENGADINSVNDEGISAIDHFVSYRTYTDSELIKILINSGAHVNNQSGINLLYSAVSMKDIPLSTILIKKGVNVNARKKDKLTGDKFGDSYSVLYSLFEKKWGHHDVSQQKQMYELVKLLIDNGADVNPKIIDNSTGEIKPFGTITDQPIFMEACYNYLGNTINFETLEYLVSKGVDVHAKNGDNETMIDRDYLNRYVKDPDYFPHDVEKHKLADYLVKLGLREKIYPNWDYENNRPKE